MILILPHARALECGDRRRQKCAPVKRLNVVAAMVALRFQSRSYEYPLVRPSLDPEGVDGNIGYLNWLGFDTDTTDDTRLATVD